MQTRTMKASIRWYLLSGASARPKRPPKKAARIVIKFIIEPEGQEYSEALRL